MKTDKTRPLARGQIWKTRVADIEILGLGKRRIHYRITGQLGRKLVSAQISGIQAMENYLKTNQAQLVQGGFNN
jgi:hypothetical protein